jgi:glycosyltransferase involved in cell wall biosynthesis
MRILIVMDPGILVPPIGYGGHERLVYMFAREYHRLGHEVELLVTKGSVVEGCVVHGYGQEGFPSTKWQQRKAIPNVWWFLLKNHSKYDLIHNFGRLAYLLPILNSRVKKIMTYGREIFAPNIFKVNKFPNRNLYFTAPSKFCMKSGSIAGNWRVVFNAVDFNKYSLTQVDVNSAPLIFLSRLERLKGAHDAIKIALSLGEKLIIAGNISKLPEEIEYFRNEIEPYIDGDLVQYVGVVDDVQKNYYLGLAKAMLFPARTEEAFGMVMVEAMACGTPVIAFNYAAMPEVIDQAITGFVVDDAQGMMAAVRKINRLDRRLCRQTAEKQFDVSVIAKQYLSLFD